eukprot:TRINITY_DN15087_c0_g1_i1.p1 TRINITY_DN15087_c0_g1~~TRINITY_DN15087_c0_g1_i1.p1  ORF type:complete len:703 (+),score=177.77 TRINITY_DN15087_c0_g1_i1:146-2254(+)
MHRFGSVIASARSAVINAGAGLGARVRHTASAGSRISQIYGQDVYHADTDRKLSNKEADVLAQRILDWAASRGAQSYNHYFHPMGLNCRTGGSDHAFLNYDFKNERPIESFSGSVLLRGETDGSSFPNGGMRATHSAGAYLFWDGLTPPFVKDSTLFLPACFYSFNGEALDEKIPLLRAGDALSTQVLRVLRVLGDKKTKSIHTSVGCEQEFFLMNRDLFMKRPDLVATGRTLLGAPPVKGQQLEHHYFATVAPRVHDFFDDLKRRCWAMGIPIENAHQEVAPGQFEVSPIFQKSSIALDTNMLLMLVIEETARDHKMAALLHEKPFVGVNGSGKHNNWSIDTNDGVNLFKVGKSKDENIRFMVFMTAMISAVSQHGDLLRLAVGVPGNDHRLGACEAPPGIVSMYTGANLLEHLEGVVNGKPLEGYGQRVHEIDIGVKRLGLQEVPTEDRNRTSPFPFVGNRFEFRAVGSSQSPGLPGTMLAAIAAEGCKQLADLVESKVGKGIPADKAVTEAVRETLKQHLPRAVFNGNGYSNEWVQEAKRRGLPNINNSVDAVSNFTAAKNLQLFSDHGILSKTEAHARQEIMHEGYAKQIALEAKCQVELARKQVIPAALRFSALLSGNAAAPHSLVENVKQNVRAANDTADALQGKLSSLHHAAEYRDQVVPLMGALRAACDGLEQVVPASEWTLPTYDQILHSVHY